MAKAGQHYENLTGNIWGYANRGDLTGVKTALSRGGVDVNAQNIAGWTPLHAACAGGHIKVVKFLIRSNAELEIRDRGGNFAVHEAAKNGHVNILEELQKSGARLEVVRLSQCKGQAVRSLIQTVTRNVNTEDIDENEVEVSTGYNRKQQKSNAFFGPRKTPISGKIKKEILRKKRANTNSSVTVDDEQEQASEQQQNYEDIIVDCTSKPAESSNQEQPQSWNSTVQKVKRDTKLSRGARRAKARNQHSNISDDDIPQNDDIEEDSNTNAVKSNFAALSLESDSATSNNS